MERLKIFFCFLIFNLALFSACAENESVIYKIDDGYLLGVGETADPYLYYLLVHVHFSFECSFEKSVDTWFQRNESEIIRSYLSIELRNYIDEIFPNYTRQELVEIITDENSTLFFDGFVEYIKDKERLKRELILDIKVTSLKMKEIGL